MGARSSALLVFPDGTRVDMDGGTVLINLSKRGSRGLKLHLLRGVVKASVAKVVSFSPVVFTTPEAEVTVLGANLKLSSGREETRLEVREGTVRLRRIRDGAEVTAGAGQVVEVDKESELQVGPLGRGGDGHMEFWLAVWLYQQG